MRSVPLLERRQSISTPPIELHSNPLEMAENDVQPAASEPVAVEIEEEKKNLIKKETVQTGSVSSDLIYSRTMKWDGIRSNFVSFQFIFVHANTH
jgi:DNA repair protein RadC